MRILIQLASACCALFIGVGSLAEMAATSTSDEQVVERYEMTRLAANKVKSNSDAICLDVDRAKGSSGSTWIGAAIAHGDDVQHGGGLNSCGCHFNHKTGDCHCHQDRGCGCKCQPARCP